MGISPAVSCFCSYTWMNGGRSREEDHRSSMPNHLDDVNSSCERPQQGNNIESKIYQRQGEVKESCLGQ